MLERQRLLGSGQEGSRGYGLRNNGTFRNKLEELRRAEPITCCCGLYVQTIPCVYCGIQFEPDSISAHEVRCTEKDRCIDCSDWLPRLAMAVHDCRQKRARHRREEMAAKLRRLRCGTPISGLTIKLCILGLNLQDRSRWIATFKMILESDADVKRQWDLVRCTEAGRDNGEVRDTLRAIAAGDYTNISYALHIMASPWASKTLSYGTCPTKRRHLKQYMLVRNPTYIEQEPTAVVRALLDAEPPANIDAQAPMPLCSCTSFCGHIKPERMEWNYRTREWIWDRNQLSYIKARKPESRETGTALCWAAVYKKYQIAKLLLERAADPNTTGGHYGRPALWWACDREPYKHDASAMVLLLLEHKADPNIASGWRRRTPLHQVASRALLGLARLLLKHSADPAAKDRNGHIPFDLAQGKDTRFGMRNHDYQVSRYGMLSPKDEQLERLLRLDQSGQLARSKLRSDELLPPSHHFVTKSSRTKLLS